MWKPQFAKSKFGKLNVEIIKIKAWQNMALTNQRLKNKVRKTKVENLEKKVGKHKG